MLDFFSSLLAVVWSHPWSALLSAVLLGVLYVVYFLVSVQLSRNPVDYVTPLLHADSNGKLNHDVVMKNHKPGVVYLFMFPRWSHSPNASMFCLRLETFLRIAKIPYTAVLGSQMSKKGKAPFIELLPEGADKAVQVDDSELAIDFLCEQFGVNPNAHLSPAQLSQGHALTRMCTDSLYYAIVYERWVENAHLVAPVLVDVGPPLSWIMRFVVSPSIKSDVHTHGFGRHHSDDRYHLAKKDIDALDEMIGRLAGPGGFIGGYRPCTFDAIAFSCVCSLLISPTPGFTYTYAVEETEHLEGYLNRVRDALFKDWDSIRADNRRVFDSFPVQPE